MTTISHRLREATAVAHQQAESATFIDDLLSGRLDADQYGRLAGQLFFIYRALEEVGAALAGDPIADAVLDDRLLRTDRLIGDLRTLGVDPGTITPLPAVERYVDAIDATRTDPARYVAHHYTRYLGDLSGGQVVAHRMRKHYGLGASALSFYAFDGIDKLKRYKDAYRDRIDALAIAEPDIERLVAEAIYAFELNQALFTDLGAARIS